MKIIILYYYFSDNEKLLIRGQEESFIGAVIKSSDLQLWWIKNEIWKENLQLAMQLTIILHYGYFKSSH